MIKKTRENGLDLLRIISAIAIVFFHSSVFLVKNADMTNIDCEAYPLVILLALWAKVGVNFFFMTSGAFVLASPRTQDIKTFYSKMWKKLCVPTIVFVALFAVIDLIHTIVWNGSFESCLARFVQGESGTHLWYMFVLIGLYLLAPAVQHMKELLGFGKFTAAAVVMVVLGFCGEASAPHFLDWDPGFIINNVGIFMLGYSLHEWSAGKKSTGKGIGMILGAVGVALVHMIGAFLEIGQGMPVIGEFFGMRPEAPLIVLSAVLMTGGMMRLNIKKDHSKGGALTYGVYLIHLLFVYSGYDIISVMKGGNFFTLVITMPEFLIIGVSATILSFAGTYLFRRIFEKR